MTNVPTQMLPLEQLNKAVMKDKTTDNMTDKQCCHVGSRQRHRRTVTGGLQQLMNEDNLTGSETASACLCISCTDSSSSTWIRPGTSKAEIPNRFLTRHWSVVPVVTADHYVLNSERKGQMKNVHQLL